VLPGVTLRRLLAVAVILLFSACTYAKEQKRPVRAADLFRLIDQADGVEVYDLRDINHARLLYSSSNQKDLSELKTAIAVEPPPDWFLCTCMPSTQIRFKRGNKEIGWVSIYEGDIIEFARWASHAHVKDKARWFQWLDTRNVTAPHEAARREEANQKAYEAAEERWKAAMPESLRSLWPNLVQNMQPGQEIETRALDSALTQQFPEAPKRIRALFNWFGSGAGPWSGFPMYEEVAERILLEYRTSELLDAVHGVTLSEAETEGVARLFGGWAFNSKRPNDRMLISADLKRALLEHSLKSSDEDKVGRARAAFE
jgi:hypothetical protein